MSANKFGKYILYSIAILIPGGGAILVGYQAMKYYKIRRDRCNAVL